MFDYALTETAESDLEEILEYISNELHNPDAARALMDELEDKIDEICKMPKSGRIVTNEYLSRANIRRFLVKNYVAYYIVDSDMNRIVILRVVYSKRSMDDVLREL